MKASTLASFAIPLLLISCGNSKESRSPHNKRSVLPARVRSETKSQIDFARHVKPILEERCAWCHNSNSQETNYHLTNREDAFRGRRIVPGEPLQSQLYLAANKQHPPLPNHPKNVAIAQGDTKVLERWILSGAVWPSGQAGQLETR